MAKIWYAKTDDSDFILIMGYEHAKRMAKVPDPKNLEKTHVLLAFTALEELDNIFRHFQGEVWSPNGEARHLIEALGLHHTSMSVGDIIEKHDGVFLVDNVGFVNLLTGEKV